MKHSELAREIHAQNIDAGWWTDLHTGESIVQTRNRPEMMMLVVSELSEADEATEMDDKLPEFQAYRVELADAAIRLYDMLGADAGDLVIDSVVEAQPLRSMFCGASAHLMQIVNRVSAAMEAYRKGRHLDYVCRLAEALGLVLRAADGLEVEIAAKRRYNAMRADHKPENRRAVGGKLF